MDELIKKIAKEIDGDLIEIRRTIHKHPEVAFCEYQTHDCVCAWLEKIEGLSIQKNVAHGTGIIATMKGNAGEGKTILLRADLDALPVKEEMVCAFSSERMGYMHACGHDAHVAWLIGTAMILSKMRNLWKGVVKFVFQPAEEIGAGAKVMVEEEQVLENPKVDMAFAAHVWPGIEHGKIGIPLRYAFGAPGRFKIMIKGKGGHGATPEEAIDPIAIGNEFYQRIPAVLMRKMKGTDSKVVSVTYMLSGKKEALNIIPNICEMGGTMRAVSLDVMRQMQQVMEYELRTLCESNGASYDIEFLHELDSVKNDRNLIEPIKQVAESIVGEENVVIIEEDNLVGEDFSEISTRVPSVFFMVGISEDDNVPVLHNSKFCFNDNILAMVSSVFAKIVLEFGK